MVHYSALVPVRNADASVTRLLGELAEVLDRLLLPYEIICVLDASVPTSATLLDQWTAQHAQLRVLQLDRPRATAATLCAGIAASRGELVLCVFPASGIAANRLPDLISRLGRYDFAFAEHQHTIGQALRRLSGMRNLLPGGHNRRNGKRLLFAASRESLAGLTLAKGALRVLPELVDQRGFRVCRVTIAPGLPPRGDTFRPSLVNRLTATWHARRFEPHLAREHAQPDRAVATPIRAPAEFRAPRPAAPTAPAIGAEQHPGKIV